MPESRNFHRAPNGKRGPINYLDTFDFLENEMLNHGVIVYYNASEGKHFGFILPDGKTSREDHVFFHNTRQVSFFFDRGQKPQQVGWFEEAKKDQRVVFEMEVGPKGYRAAFWGDEATYESVLHQCQNRTYYRLRHRKGRIPLSRLQEKPDYRTMWEGEDLTQLRKRYTKTLYPCHESEFSGTFFEEYIKDDGFYRCDDPR